MTRLRHGLGIAGIVLALAGIALENGVVIWFAIGVLAGSVLIRVTQAIRARRRDRAL